MGEHILQSYTFYCPRKKESTTRPRGPCCELGRTHLLQSCPWKEHLSLWNNPNVFKINQVTSGNLLRALSHAHLCRGKHIIFCSWRKWGGNMTHIKNKRIMTSQGVKELCTQKALFSPNFSRIRLWSDTIGQLWGISKKQTWMTFTKVFVGDLLKTSFALNK